MEIESYRIARARDLEGLFPAVVTPFKRDQERWNHSINYDSFGNLLERFVESGIKGVVVAGCTGSASVLNHQEQIDLVKYAQENFQDRLLIIAGDGSNCTRESLDMMQRIEQETGVIHHLSISPYYNKPSDRGIMEHYETLADSIQGGIILYSVPSRTGGKGILPEVVRELSQHPNIIGIKEASGNLDRVREMIQNSQTDDFYVVSGNDGEAPQAIEMGAKGLISTAANIIPLEMNQLISSVLDKKNVSDERYQQLYASLFPGSQGNPSPNPNTVHYALNRLGFDVGIPRLPLGDISRKEASGIDNCLMRFSLECGL